MGRKERKSVKDGITGRESEKPSGKQRKGNVWEVEKQVKVEEDEKGKPASYDYFSWQP